MSAEASGPRARVTRRVFEQSVAFLGFTILAIWGTWPLARRLSYSVPFPEDPLLTTWILDWQWWSLTNGLPLFHANIFFPLKNTLAFSEHMTGIAVFTFPFRAAGIGPLTAHNLAVLLGFATSGYCAFLLGRALTSSALAGAVAGVFFTLLPYRFTQSTHVQMIWSGSLPLLLACAVYYARRPSAARSLALALAFTWNGSVNVHWLLFGSVAIALTLLLFAWSSGSSPISFFRPLLLPLVGASGALVLVHLPYYRVSQLYSLERGREETLLYSARLRDWLRPNPELWPYERLVDPLLNPERMLFPGVIVIVLAVIGICFVRRGDTSSFPAREGMPRALGPFRGGPLPWVLLGWVALGVLGSLGLNAFFHSFLFEHVFGFQAIRVPARWAMVAYTGLAGLAACGTRVLTRKFGSMAAILVCIALAVELKPESAPHHRVPSRTPSVYTWLAGAQVPGGLLEVPLRHKGSDYWYVYYSSVHHRSLVNGTSGFVPDHIQRLSELYRSSPIPDDFLSLLEDLGCSLLVVHREDLDDRSADVRQWISRSFDQGRLQFLGVHDGTDFVFAIVANLRDWPKFAQPVRRDPSGRTPFETAVAFVVDDAPVYRPVTFGTVEAPRPGEGFLTGVEIRGWVISPQGVEDVFILLGDERVRVRAALLERPDVADTRPWYAKEMIAGYAYHFPERPEAIESGPVTVQIEVVHPSGESSFLPGPEFQWF